MRLDDRSDWVGRRSDGGRTEVDDGLDWDGLRLTPTHTGELWKTMHTFIHENFNYILSIHYNLSNKRIR